MVGSSLRIYKGITQLLRARLKDAQGLVMGMQVCARHYTSCSPMIELSAHWLVDDPDMW